MDCLITMTPSSTTRSDVQRKRSRDVRAGFTLLELVVTVVIIGLLAALLLPAAQHIRESSRKATCQQQLHQFGVALYGFAEVHKAFPTATLPESPYRRLLPWFEQRTLLDAIHAAQQPGHHSTDNIDWYVESYGCPSDPIVQRMMEHGDTSYYFNTGTALRTTRNRNGFRKSTREDTRQNEIEDGLSQTMAMAERLTWEWGEGKTRTVFDQPRRDFWWTVTRYTMAGNEEALAVDQCRNHRTVTTPQYAGVSAPNLDGGSDYDHLLTPNHPACYNGPESFNVNWDGRLVSASSEHPGGVNGLVGDGSVRFASESIDPAVWSAIGTRNGHESISMPF